MSRRSKKSLKTRRQKAKVFDKYFYYERAVQSPDTDVKFFRKVYRELRKSEPKILREDFCGTFQIACEWVKLASDKKSFGIDLDLEPITYGCEKHLVKLKPEQQKRIEILRANVMDPALPLADIVVAQNFSYFIFQERERLLEYFSSVRAHLKNKGMFILDCFGGSLCHEENEEFQKKRGFIYYWDQASFDPISHRAKFHIHFKLKGERKRENVFTYDWRMWSIPELRDVLKDAGFKTTHVYWEGTDSRGGGDGKFRRSEKGEACQSWISYIVAT